LATSRRLKSLQRDLLRCAAQGHPAKVEQLSGAEGEVEVRLEFEAVRGKRSTRLRGAEFELLRALPGVREALGPMP
jgi:hypothetical protein